MLEGPSAVDQDQDFGNPLAYRAGLVISSLFTACTSLALNAGLIWNRATGDARTNKASSELQDEITRACRVLAKAGEKSTFAANLLRNLVRNHCNHLIARCSGTSHNNFLPCGFVVQVSLEIHLPLPFLVAVS